MNLKQMMCSNLPLSAILHPSICAQRGGLVFQQRRLQQPVIAKRSLQVLRELKNKPHRVFLAGAVSEQGFIGDLFSTEVEDGEQTLVIQSNNGTICNQSKI